METPHVGLDAAQLKAMLFEVADRVIAAEPELSEADRKLGDGDHGLGMQRGMVAAKEALSEAAADSGVGELFTVTGNALMRSMGGASGVVFGSLFRAGGKALEGHTGGFGAGELSLCLSAAAEAIMARGGAGAGDKTMLDALLPAGERAVELAGRPLGEVLPEVAAAAEAGRDASRDMVATIGRAKTLGERSLGHPDAGACSVAIILRAMADFVAAAAPAD